MSIYEQSVMNSNLVAILVIASVIIHVYIACNFAMYVYIKTVSMASLNGS